MPTLQFCSFQLAPLTAGQYLLEVFGNGLPVGGSPFNVTVDGGSCALESLKLMADTQPATAGQPYELYFTIYDWYGNPCVARSLHLAVVAISYETASARFTGLSLKHLLQNPLT